MTANMSVTTLAKTKTNVATCGESELCFKDDLLTLFNSQSCREGLSDAPHTKRKTQGVTEAPAADTPKSANAVKKITRLHSPSQTLQKKPYMKDKLTLHESRPAGSILSPHPRGDKLDAPRSAKGKVGPPPIDHDVSFTDLGYSMSQSAVMDIPEEWDGSDEDLPETIIPLAKGKENG